jgi:hypothetical protein
LALTLADFARRAPVEAIVPVAHGAAAALLRDGQLLLPPMDYETPLPAAERTRYDSERDEFAHTGSPALPDGLNLGAQLHLLESLHPGVTTAPSIVVPWPQYWAWCLSGVAASEVTSLGCHNGSVAPGRRGAVGAGRAARLGPQSRAVASGGRVPWHADTRVERAHRPRARRARALRSARFQRGTARGARLSRTPASGIDGAFDRHLVRRDAQLPTRRSTSPRCRSAATASSTSMRTADRRRPRGSWAAANSKRLRPATRQRIDSAADQPRSLPLCPPHCATARRCWPTFAAGVAHFRTPVVIGCSGPTIATKRGAMAALYVALVADVALDLIGARERIVVEGRFAEAQVFVRALANVAR